MVGVCEPGWGHAGRVLDIEGHHVPVLGDESTVIDAVGATQADMVAVSNTEFFGNEGMRALAWQLEATGTDLVVAPGVVDVAGPRLQVRPVAGLPAAARGQAAVPRRRQVRQARRRRRSVRSSPSSCSHPS